MRRNDKSWPERGGSSGAFLSGSGATDPDGALAVVRERLVQLEQQVLAQYTATATYATIAQHAVEQARAEARADLDRAQAVIIGLLDRLRAEIAGAGIGGESLGGAATEPLNASASGAIDTRLTSIERRIIDLVATVNELTLQNAELRARLKQ